MGKLKQVPFWGTIRGRVAVVLAVPTCLLLALTGAGVADRAADWWGARDTAERVELTLDVQELVRQLQRERGLTSGLLGGAEDYRSPLADTRRRVDEARDALDGSDPAVDGALGKLNRLAAVRADADQRSLDRTTALDFYTEAITALNAVELVDPRGDTALADGLAALTAVVDATESVALERGFMNGVFAAGSFAEGEYTVFSEVRAARMAALAVFARHATDAQRSGLETAFAGAEAERAAGYEDIARHGADGRPLGVEPAGWWADMTVLVDDLHRVQQGIGSDLRTRAGEVSSVATAQLGGFLALGVLIAALAAALAWVSSRSITRPLGALARQAHEVAARRLPETVRAVQDGTADPDGTRGGRPAARPAPEPDGGGSGGGAEEISRLAAALHKVELAAVELAAEQAALRRNSTESLSGLGRRNQRLLKRQLQLITALESQEMDPDALAGLFELDHLATRMRRNADSLLILTGEEGPPALWKGTIPVTDVVRSAISEVEDYRRVTVAETDPCRIQGSAVAELSHLLAELIENALTATPADRAVEVYGWRDGGEYCLAVVDRGTGMTGPELARANGRLSGRESFLDAPARALGHYVVGRLAARLGAQVELRHTEAPTAQGPVHRGAGITAFVALPPRLLAPEPEARGARRPRVPAGAA
ncbi:sensor histidine kinase [Streptomyces aidingensis]|uniref:histidine kinase n=1 Tax=Streptomyces aidingensis TaxID=910347 RepID=A0A1I1TLS3_9ACTN|nr:ATP-binding protein [Streptomyces aidingensis]SFD59474.1 Histidine kinase-, DNA gyrase B-, and HSP90-like ATPase [Streptomyces aidingensis]